VRLVLVALVSAALCVASGCGGDEPTPVDDEEAIRSVLVEDELGGPERCTEIYTEAYLAENWNKHVTSIPGDTPLEKCEADEPLPGITGEDMKITVNGFEGDTTTATARVRAQAAVGFELIRDGESWRINGFSD
jgi:hypothetical protein